MSFYLNPWFIITNLGDPRLWTALCVILFFVRMHYKRKIKPYNKKFHWVGAFIIFAGFAMASSLAVSQGMKEYFQIPRGCIPETNIYCLDSFSFPSGHTAIAFTVFAGIFSIFRRRKYLPILIIPFVVAASRLALGVHTIYDVVGGAAVGLAVFGIFYVATKKVDFIREKVNLPNKN